MYPDAHEFCDDGVDNDCDGDVDTDDESCEGDGDDDDDEGGYTPPKNEACVCTEAPARGPMHAGRTAPPGLALLLLALAHRRRAR